LFNGPATFAPAVPTLGGPALFGVARDSFHGPGLNNWDMALLKDTAITERVGLQFRAEFFNIFNHAQFFTPSGVTTFSSGLATSGAFGQVPGARDPRIGQLSLKLNF
jgi:hypothetical protein